MEFEIIEKFFLYCLVINTAIYAATSVASLVMRNFLFRVHRRLFAMEEEAVLESVQRYLSNYKLLITIFNFTPWLALYLIRQF